METEPDLPEPLAQGLFGAARTYPVILRFSTTPGDMLADNVNSPTGLAVKVLEVEGEMLPGHEGQGTQDFVCIDADAFDAPDAKSFLEQTEVAGKTLHVPEEVKHVMSLGARLVGAGIDRGADYNALEQLIKRFFRNETAVWEVRVLLASAEAGRYGG